MTKPGFLQIALYLFFLLLLVKPLGWYMAQVYQGRPCFLDIILRPCERLIYKICGIHAQEEMGWKTYLSAMLFLNLAGLLIAYLLQRLQFYLPLNPQELPSPSPTLAFNTAISFTTNTNWQAYSGETTMSYLTQMLALTVQNFISAATGMSLLVALIRGIIKHESNSLGNFWVDTVRGILYILLPLSLLFALTLCSQGVIQNFKPFQKINLTHPFTYQQPIKDATGQTVLDNQGNPKTTPVTITEQILPMGPVASQIAIKQLGTNGGGFFNANSAHPFENPTPLTNFLEMVAILLIPAAFCFMFGTMVHDKRQGWAILIAMSILFAPCLILEVVVEQAGNPAFHQMGIDTTAQSELYPAGNMEGKETRFGVVSSAIWATATTASSNGSVNSMLDSFTPLGGMVPLWMMHLGEVSFGGIGSGLSGMIMLIILTVFVAGLMVGRTPEYLGKKIEPYEMKMASIAVLIMPLIVLITTAYATVTSIGISSIANPGAHGFTEILYAFTSMGNNNGSAFAGLNANTPFYNIVGGVMMLISRYWLAIPILAIAGSLVKKKRIPNSSGTLATHTPLFITLLVYIAMILGALSFLPALALGPIVEHLMLWGKYGY
ncbi:potassium-transporting ATPase subunit KdpA [Fluoribacter gormanii]|uniref:Potassium-transporting ATPase potassium-binding subunit n=1 Tax=Fluoribacter gormanii TaxID=464 RepID=A0A377GL00_9GAMM|nr:potassium-transporting ATPase subunit KdpA [Fluoribacter gormanii]KTD01027.1 potassium translocating ATPase, subunit A [Fluoribacter gormanii]SIR77714.1 K+-transporting ATPase ATPase A chain [Fluoribacter gormanii]STO25487.1 potassium-transporting ATPase subunit A [Fluoribacter gormanii]